MSPPEIQPPTVETAEPVVRRGRRRAGLALMAAGAVVAGLFGATRTLTARAEASYPATGRFIEVDGRRIHVVDQGEGPAVVLLHGAYGGLDDWRATVLDELATRYRVIAMDRPGSGWSDRGGSAETCATPVEQGRVVRDVLQELGVERPVLVGFSWSGPVVLSMTLEHPDEVAACVTVNGATHPWPGPLDLGIRIPDWPLVGAVFSELLVAPLGSVLADDAVAKAFAPQDVAAHYDRSPAALALRPKAYRAVAADLRALRPTVRELAPRYGEITVPLVVLVGEGDLIAGPHVHSYPLARAVPGAELVSVADGGHQLPYSHPGAVIRVIDRAVERSAGTD